MCDVQGKLKKRAEVHVISCMWQMVLKKLIFLLLATWKMQLHLICKMFNFYDINGSYSRYTGSWFLQAMVSFRHEFFLIVWGRQKLWDRIGESLRSLEPHMKLILWLKMMLYGKWGKILHIICAYKKEKNSRHGKVEGGNNTDTKIAYTRNVDRKIRILWLRSWNTVPH